MNKFNKKIIIGLLVLAFLSPLSIWILNKFNSGDAWGEWSAETIKHDLGFIPVQLKKYASLWNAPIKDYGSESSSLLVRSGNYVLSGLIALGIIAIITFVLLKLVRKHE